MHDKRLSIWDPWSEELKPQMSRLLPDIEHNFPHPIRCRGGGHLRQLPPAYATGVILCLFDTSTCLLLIINILPLMHPPHPRQN